MSLSVEELRELTRNHLQMELNKILDNYMKVYDEYYSTGSRDSAFLKDLVDSLLGISAVLEVYTRDGKIHPSYAMQKLNNSKNYIDSVISFYEDKLEIEKNNLKVNHFDKYCKEKEIVWK